MISVKDRLTQEGDLIKHFVSFPPLPHFYFHATKSHLSELPLLVKIVEKQLLQSQEQLQSIFYKQLGCISKGRTVPATDLHKPSYACIYSRDLLNIFFSTFHSASH